LESTNETKQTIKTPEIHKMILEKTEIYPVRLYFGNILDDGNITENDLITIQDVIENLSPDTHTNLHKPQSRPAITDTGLFYDNVAAINKVKKLFHDSCISLHEDKFPQFKGKLKVYDSVARGVVVNHNTTVLETMSNHPWTYTGILFCRVPPNLGQGMGDVVFQDPTPASDYNDLHGLFPVKGNISIFPGWLKYRFRPISIEQGAYDTIMMMVMNCMIVHTITEAELRAEQEKRNAEADPHAAKVNELFQLGPQPKNPGEVDIGEY